MNTIEELEPYQLDELERRIAVEAAHSQEELAEPSLSGFAIPSLSGFAIPSLSGFAIPSLSGFAIP